jgi:hypothetical protein
MAGVDKQHSTNGHAMLKATTGLGIALSFVLSSQLYPFMLSSAFTARSIVKEKSQTSEVKTDMLWAFGLSVISTGVIAYYLGNDWKIFAVGSIFAFALLSIYSYRGDISLTS